MFIFLQWLVVYLLRWCKLQHVADLGLIFQGQVWILVSFVRLTSTITAFGVSRSSSSQVFAGSADGSLDYYRCNVRRLSCICIKQTVFHLKSHAIFFGSGFIAY
ncbi:CMF_collapsed_G0013350.mRNA.1.CDS.1 [Saccharomyces cerevisiae]|nr:CMF_collapsed_G0013350.mRNA.1.CDS.1 [Saccharomyces cerevisiae]